MRLDVVVPVLFVDIVHQDGAQEVALTNPVEPKNTQNRAASTKNTKPMIKMATQNKIKSQKTAFTTVVSIFSSAMFLVPQQAYAISV